MESLDDVAFRPMVEGDLAQLATWLSQDHVRRWWGTALTLDEARAKYLPRIRGEAPTEMFVVTNRGNDVAMMQRYRLADHAEWAEQLVTAGLELPDAVGIDYLIGELDALGKGLGTRMIQAFTAELGGDLPRTTHVVAAPQVDNIASCRALANAGFELQWSGQLPSDDPSDEGPSAVYVRALT